MMHFNIATLEILYLNEDMAISAMKRGLKSFKFAWSLDKMLSRTYLKLLEHAYKYVCVKERDSNRCESEKKDQKKKQKNRAPAESSRISAHKGASSCRWSPKPNNYGCRYDYYTALSAPRAQIIMEIEREDYLHCPPLMKASREAAIRGSTVSSIVTMITIPNSAFN